MAERMWVQDDCELVESGLIGASSPRSNIRIYSGLFACLVLAFSTPTSLAQTMSLPGKSGVSSSGAATYSIPIAVPPGTAGMSPSLSIEYNSQSGSSAGAFGSGILGVSWSLAGLPAISRCPRTWAQDGVRGGVNFDANDRFCLDGRRLVAIDGAYGADGTVYRTEIESFSKIISHGTAGTGPAWFEVRSKSGQVLQFGNTPDSRSLVQGKTVARSWAVNKVSDTKGNYFAVTYVNDAVNGQTFPSRIDYTGNSAASLAPYNSVQFVYDTSRPDVVPTYHAGSLSKTAVRLTNVQTYAGSQLVSDYRFGYQQGTSTRRSQLATVTLCDGGGNCLPATTFSWNNSEGDAFSQIYWSYTGGLNLGTPPTNMYVPLSGDFNGDGKTDFAVLSNLNIYLFISNGDGTFTQTTRPHADAWEFSVPPDANRTPLTGDFNGDGRTDIAVVSSGVIYLFMNNGNGTFTQILTPNSDGWRFGSPPTAEYSPIVGDFNGDGKTDIAFLSHRYLYFFISNGDGTFTQIARAHTGGWLFDTPPHAIYTPMAGDFNGDGKTDIAVLSNSYFYLFMSSGDGSFTQVAQPHADGWLFGTPPTDQYSPIVGDFNGDGKADVAVLSHRYIYLFTGRGDGSFTQTARAHTDGWLFGVPPGAIYTIISGDFNGDGKSDIAGVSAASFYLFTSEGGGAFTQSTSVNSPPLSSPVEINGWNSNPLRSIIYTPLVVDYNGDGKSDVAFLDAAGVWQLRSNKSSADTIATISTGTGATISMFYEPLTNSAVYTRDNNATYPIQDVQAPIHVVSRVENSNGIGGTLSTAYAYAGAKSDISGHGFLGFRQMKATDLQTNIVETTEFLQMFPYTGLAASSTTKLGALTLKQGASTYQLKNAGGAATVGTPSVLGAPYRVSVAQTVASSADLDGTALPTVTSSYQYDAYGNATQVTVSTSDGVSKVTSNAYANDPANWYLGRLNAATVVSTRP